MAASSTLYRIDVTLDANHAAFSWVLPVSGDFIDAYLLELITVGRVSLRVAAVYRYLFALRPSHAAAVDRSDHCSEKPRGEGHEKVEGQK